LTGRGAPSKANFCGDLRDIEKARYRLATALSSVAGDDSRDIELLKRSALEAMALAYRDKPIAHLL